MQIESVDIKKKKNQNNFESPPKPLFVKGALENYNLKLCFNVCTFLHQF